MCGLAGYFSPKGGVSEHVCHHMIDQLTHRGPDDGGVWHSQSDAIALGHRRLSIQDLSELGHQPMRSASDRYIIVYNGEIYNFQDVQKILIGKRVQFCGHSDTEVLLASIEYWGIENALKKMVGMFAFALWDKQKRTLTLARDRMGEKPLYYGWQGDSFLFASELKALKIHPDWLGGINRDALTLYMRHSCVPAPYSIYQGIYKLMPGTFVQLQASEWPTTLLEPFPYWQASKVAELGVSKIELFSDGEAIESLDSLLRHTVREMMVSDVPLGAFLSGGIDSSLVVSLMQQESEKKVRTFSIGFHEPGYNEAVHASAVAAHLGTEHTEMYVTPEKAREVIPKLAALYDEPFSDVSQIPTFLVSEMTKQHVTVALSGDGGDELFAGYNRYVWGKSLWNKLKRVPMPVRSMASHMIKGVAPSSWDKVFRMLYPLLPPKFSQPQAGDKLHKISDILTMQSPEDIYRTLVSHWKKTGEVVLSGREPLTVLTDKCQHANLDDFVQRMQFLDMVTYLPDDILVKLDRAAMGVSLETRVPFLDHRVVEYAWKIPMSMKIRDGQGKWILRQILNRYVPKKLIEGPKMGFGVPVDAWLRGPLREWSEELLDETRLRQEGFFYVDVVRQKWAEHLSGEKNWQYLLWDVLMFQLWLDHWEKN